MPTWISSPAQRGAAPALQGLYNNRGGHALARREGGRDNLPSTATAIAIDFFGACLSLDRRRKFNANVIFIFFISCPMWQNYCPPLRLNYTGADAAAADPGGRAASLQSTPATNFKLEAVATPPGGWTSEEGGKGVYLNQPSEVRVIEELSHTLLPVVCLTSS